MGEFESTTTKVTHNNKGLSRMLSHNMCYGLWPLLTALVLNIPDDISNGNNNKNTH